jgi:hypothetical protein
MRGAKHAIVKMRIGDGFAAIEEGRRAAVPPRGGVGIVYACGIPVLALLGGLTLQQAAAGSAIFLPGDLIKAAIAASVAMFVKRGYPIIAPRVRPNDHA